MGLYYTDESGVFLYDSEIDGDTYALGAPKDYARALLSQGLDTVTVIKETAKKYTCINDNVLTLTLERNQ